MERIFEGHGVSYTSFGELIQGVTETNRYLISLPVNFKSYAKVKIKLSSEINTSYVNCKYSKSKVLAEYLITKYISKYNFWADIEIKSEIPHGKGISSSTADMNATLNAIINAFGLIIDNDHKSKIFALVEPHDPVHYKSCCLYDPDEGKLIRDYSYIPNIELAVLDIGGELDTIRQRNILQTKISNQLIKFQSDLLNTFNKAFNEKNKNLIFELSTKAACNAKNSHPIWSLVDIDFVNLKNHFEALGVIITHTGTCLGFAFDNEIKKNNALKELKKIACNYAFSDIFELSTLKKVQPDD